MIESVLKNWDIEIESNITDSNTLCIAIFNKDRSLLFANSAIKELFSNLNPADSLLNPSFDKLITKDCSDCKIYKGYITFGDYSEINSSILGTVYRKNDQILIIGGADSAQLMHQNLMMHNLNREIGNLQRQLIKEKRNLEETLKKLNEANKELNEANATKDKFFSIIAHDLKNPFTALLGFTEFLRTNFRTLEVKEAEEMIEMLHSSSNATYKLLEDLLLWSRSQLGKVTFNPESVKLQEIWKELSEQLSVQAEDKGIILNFKDTFGIELYCDRNMVKTIIRNLVSNAIKFSYKGSDVDIKVNLNGDMALITVSDKGVGIEKEKIEKLWVVGAHNSTAGTDNETGTGLGLVLCKEFIQTNGGDIRVESEVGKGSDFIFTIPVNK
jgi:signal transduction histidine kinase